MFSRNPDSFFNNKERDEEIEGEVLEFDLLENDIASADEKSAVKKLLEKETKEIIDKALATLSPRERDIIQSRLGFGGIAEQTLEEISKRYGVSPTRVQQIEAKALKKLKALFKESGLHPSYFGEIDDSLPYSVDRRFELETLYQQLIELRQKIKKGRLQLLNKGAGDYSNPEFEKLKVIFLDKKNLVIEEFKKTIEQLKEEIEITEQEITEVKKLIKIAKTGVVQLNSPVDYSALAKLEENYKKQSRRIKTLKEMLYKINSKEFRYNF